MLPDRPDGSRIDTLKPSSGRSPTLLGASNDLCAAFGFFHVEFKEHLVTGLKVDGKHDQQHRSDDFNHGTWLLLALPGIFI
ncbi:hypothetical protein M422DRAFT_248048 [Sphaerobolus stellatus SS14]|nr:hypothetical protein M422DRAFT_248048 [Sphaerobolus stellatus SS14]